jgi:hypothetical protein
MMRELSAKARLHVDDRSLPERSTERAATFAVYSALALIAAIVLGTLSVHPF